MKHFTALVLIGIMLLTAGACAESATGTLQDMYAQAELLMATGDYSGAAAKFETLGAYSDASQMAMYCKAVAVAETMGLYDVAVSAFNGLGDFKDSRQMSAYYTARGYQAVGDSIDIFSASDNDLETAKFSYDKGAEAYAGLALFKDCWTRMSECRTKSEAVKAEQNARAAAKLETAYQAALALEESGEYQKAIDAFRRIQDYKDSQRHITACDNAIIEGIYREAIALEESGEYQKAIDAFKRIQDYKDSRKHITSDTAYRGDRGNEAWIHAGTRGGSYSTGFYKIGTSAEGHVDNAYPVTKSDITDLGIPASNTTYTLQSSGHQVSLVPSEGSPTVITTADEQVTSSANHYTPEEQTGSDITDTASGAGADAKVTGDTLNDMQDDIHELTSYAKADNFNALGAVHVEVDRMRTDTENLSEKTDQITARMDAAEEMVAEKFNASKSYISGEFVVYQDSLYKFINNHTGAWNSADAEKTDVSEMIEQASSGQVDEQIEKIKDELNAKADITSVGLIAAEQSGFDARIEEAPSDANEALQKVAELSEKTQGTGNELAGAYAAADIALTKSGEGISGFESRFASMYPGSKVSLIGDSIDTFDQEGYKIDGYAMFYPIPIIGVTTVEDTWWKRVIDQTGATIEINASYSGSRVTNTLAGAPDLYARTSLIGHPDLIFVGLGTNDSGAGVALGEYDFDSAYTNLSESQFRPAYIKGIKALQALYPYAQIVCIAKIMGDEYKESIAHIANTLGVMYIDVSDYESINGAANPHPKAYGMRQIASRVLNPTDATLKQSHISACDNAIIEGIYWEAIALEESGEYQKAIESFKRIQDYKDSRKHITACDNAIMEGIYREAIALEEGGEYQRALEAFKRIQDYKDSRAHMIVCENEPIYLEALTLEEKEEFQKAVAKLTGIKGYKDCEERIKKIYRRLYRKAGSKKAGDYPLYGGFTLGMSHQSFLDTAQRTGFTTDWIQNMEALRAGTWGYYYWDQKCTAKELGDFSIQLFFRNENGNMADSDTILCMEYDFGAYGTKGSQTIDEAKIRFGKLNEWLTGQFGDAFLSNSAINHLVILPEEFRFVKAGFEYMSDSLPCSMWMIPLEDGGVMSITNVIYQSYGIQNRIYFMLYDSGTVDQLLE